MLRTWGRVALDDDTDTGTAAGTSNDDDDGGAGDPPPAGGKADDDAAAKTRREAADLRRRLKEAEAERDQLRESQMSEQEKAAQRAEAAEKTAQARLERLERTSLKAEVGALAGKVGIRMDAVDAAIRLLDHDTVDFDDGEAQRSSVEKALRHAVKEFPFLARAGKADAASSGDPAGGGGDLGTRIGQALRKR